MDSKPPILTVCIPTYNRKNIFDTVAALIPQLTNEVSIKIFDNHSDVPVESILSDFSKEKIKIIRNSTNVGLSGNIIKCFEYCDTDWMWLLSDDDIPAQNAISTILNTLKWHPDVSVIKYSSDTGYTKHNVQEEVIAIGQKDFISKITNFSNLLFISSTVCRVGEMKTVAKDAYYFTQGFAPHLVFILAHLAAIPTAKVLYSPLNVVSIGGWNIPGHATWNGKLVYKSLADVVFLIKDQGDRKELFHKIDSYGHFNKGPFAGLDLKSIIKTIVLAKNDGEEHNMISEYLNTAAFTYWADSMPSQKFLLRSALISLTIAFLHLPIINSIIKLFIKSGQEKKNFYYNRYFLYNKDYRL